MKKLILSMLLITATFAVVAQKNPLKRAEKELSAGQLDLAKASIEEAMTHEKSKDDQDLWFVRGNIYRAFMAKGDDAAFNEVLKSYTKFKELGKGGFKPFQSDSALSGLYNQIMNEGISGYNEKNWDKALKGFDRASIIQKGDTTALQNYLAVTENIEDPAKVNQDKMIEKATDFLASAYKGDKSWVYRKIYAAHLAKDPEDKEGKAMNILDKAIAAFPASQEFIGYKINTLIKANRTYEAIAATEVAIAKGGANLEIYYLNLGILNENIKNGAKAEAAYKKSIEIKPDYFDALFSLSAYYFNKDDKAKTYRAMDNKTIQSAEGKKLAAEIVELYKLAIPYLEKATVAEFKAKPEYGQALNVLKDAYKAAGNLDKAKEVQVKIDEFYK